MRGEVVAAKDEISCVVPRHVVLARANRVGDEIEGRADAVALKDRRGEIVMVLEPVIVGERDPERRGAAETERAAEMAARSSCFFMVS